MRRPLLLLPRPLDQFVLGDHARELIDASGGVGRPPGRIPYGALVRAPAPVRGAVASSIAGAVVRSLPDRWDGDRGVLVAYHAIQWPAALALLRRGAARELWYCRWDRYEAAHDAGRAHRLLGAWHEAMAERSSLTFAVSGALAELEVQAGRSAIVVGLSADAFPDGPLAPGGRGAELVEAALGAGAADAGRPAEAPVAVSLGHLGRRTNWAWLRGAVERLPELRLLLVGAWHEDEVGHDADYRWLRSAPRVAWLGALPDADAAHVIAQADVGLVPFTVDPFNDAGLPTRILKYARLGRPTIAPPLAGSRTWERATTFVDGPDALAAALRERAGLRHRPDEALRAWALEQTAAHMNAPLHAQLRAGGPARLSSEPSRRTGRGGRSR